MKERMKTTLQLQRIYSICGIVFVRSFISALILYFFMSIPILEIRFYRKVFLVVNVFILSGQLSTCEPAFQLRNLHIFHFSCTEGGAQGFIFRNRQPQIAVKFWMFHATSFFSAAISTAFEYSNYRADPWTEIANNPKEINEYLPLCQATTDCIYLQRICPACMITTLL